MTVMDILLVANSDVVICTESQNYSKGQYILHVAKRDYGIADLKNMMSESLLQTEVKRIESRGCLLLKIAD